MEELHLKYGGNWFTKEKIANAKQNIKKYEWANELKNTAIKKADACIAKGAEFYWTAITSSKLPRNIHTNYNEECPVCGKEMTEKYGVYSWICHTEDNSWKIECPNCHVILPSNDFKSYYESSLDDKGFFQPETANICLLNNVNVADNRYVDNGFGWTSDNGAVWAFAAYYNLFGVWYSLVLDNLKNLTDAFIYTEDIKYADLGLVLLDRVADVYPDMHLSDFRGWKPYYNNCGGTGEGKIAGCISEPGITEILLKAIDAFVPVLPLSNACDILNSIYKNRKLSLSKKSVYSISEHLYRDIVQEVYKGITKREIFGNTGMHEKSLALAAVVAGKSTEADQWVEWIFNYDQGTSYRSKEPVKGGNLLYNLYTRVDRDGFGDEVSPTYNSIWLKMFYDISDLLQHYSNIQPEYNLRLHPRFIKMTESYLPLILNYEYIPHTGDAGKCGNPGTDGFEHLFSKLYMMHKSPELGHMAWRLNGCSAKNLFNDIFLEDPKSKEQDLEKAAKDYIFKNITGASLPSYGFSSVFLNITKDDRSRPCLYMYYGHNKGHGHYDTLNIGYYNYRMELMPDLGYPEYTDGFNRKRKEWTHNTVSHNTVVADKSQAGHDGGSLTGYASGKEAGFISADGLPAYPSLKSYERSCAIVWAGSDKSYIIDSFKVEGGADFHYLLHGTKGSTQVLNGDASVITQQTGTYMGEEVMYAKDPAVDYSKPYEPYNGSGFHYLKNIRKIIYNGDDPVTVRWNVQDNWNVHQGKDIQVKMDIRAIGKYDKITLATGIPPQNKLGNMKELDYLILNKKSQDPFHFISCISSWTGSDFIKSIERIYPDDTCEKDDVVIVKIQLSDGSIDYVLFSKRNNKPYIIEEKWIVSGSFCICRIKDDECRYALITGGNVVGRIDKPVISEKNSVLEGIVTDFTKDMSTDCFIELKINNSSDFNRFDHLNISHLYIEKKNGGTAAFIIQSFVLENGYAKIYIGNNSPIIGLINPVDPEQGFNYEIHEGMKAWIPITYEY